MHLPNQVAVIMFCALFSASFCTPLRSADVVAEQEQVPCPVYPPRLSRPSAWLGMVQTAIRKPRGH